MKQRETTGKKGYSLLELSVVLSIFLALLGMAVVIFHNFGRGSELKGAARALAGALRAARSQALTRSQPCSVLFDTANERYWITDSSGKIMDKRYILPLGIDLRDISDKKSGEGEFDPDGDGEYDDGEEIVITFNPTGSTGDACSIHVAASREPLSENNNRNNPDRLKCYTITVTKFGKVTLYYYGRNIPWYAGDLP